MDVFGAVVGGNRDFLLRAAVTAGHRLGLFDALSQTRPLACSSLAASVGVAGARVRPLLDALAMEGVLHRSRGEGDWVYAAEHVPPADPDLPAEGLGLLAEVIRTDRPLDPGPHLLAHSQHLDQVGEAAASELVKIHLVGRCVATSEVPHLLDLGGGLGTYSRAFQREVPSARATLVERPEVAELAKSAQQGCGEGVRVVAGDIFDGDWPPHPYDIVLLSNVLHLYPPSACARLVERARSAMAPGGELIVKEVAIQPDRSGPPVGVWFDLNMALYTRAGRAHDAGEIGEWMREAGLGRVRVAYLATAPESVVLLGRR